MTLGAKERKLPRALPPFSARRLVSRDADVIRRHVSIRLNGGMNDHSIAFPLAYKDVF